MRNESSDNRQAKTCNRQIIVRSKPVIVRWIAAAFRCRIVR
jgi:hypothetical protein